MTTEQPNLAAVLQRLERVELQNKRLTILGISCSIVFFAAFLLTQTSWFTGGVEARKIQIKDEYGITRLELGTSSDGAGLSVLGYDGKSRAILAVSSSGPRLEFRDSAGMTTYQVP